MPIYPKPFNSLLPDLQLRLAGNVELRKESYVNTQKVYTFPLSLLEPYSRRTLALRMAELLERVSAGHSVPGDSIREWDSGSRVA